MSTYTVQSGDSLWSIAQAVLGTGGHWPQLAKLNAIASPYTIQPGEVLRLPSGAQASVVPATHVTGTLVPRSSATAVTTSAHSLAASFFNLKYLLIGAAAIAAGYLVFAQSKRKKGRKSAGRRRA